MEKTLQERIKENHIIFITSDLDAESAIRQLLPQKLKDQYTFKTEKALSLLKFLEVKEL